MNVLLKHWDVFDYYNERIPSAKTNVKHHIKTGDTPPIKSKCRPLNPIIGEKVKNILDDRKQRGSENHHPLWHCQYLWLIKETMTLDW